MLRGKRKVFRHTERGGRCFLLSLGPFRSVCADKPAFLEILSSEVKGLQAGKHSRTHLPMIDRICTQGRCVLFFFRGRVPEVGILLRAFCWTKSPGRDAFPKTPARLAAAGKGKEGSADAPQPEPRPAMGEGHLGTHPELGLLGLFFVLCLSRSVQYGNFSPLIQMPDAKMKGRL